MTEGNGMKDEAGWRREDEEGGVWGLILSGISSDIDEDIRGVEVLEVLIFLGLGW